MQPAIRIENLGKRYRVNHAIEHNGYRTLRETLVDAVAAPLRRLKNPGHDGRVEEFWALRDVNFDVQPGEVVGIIGRNGAGKSTLLKILSRITKPTTGHATIHGRVGSLLEVGTGFHPELTGRENIYMNGSILGMSRREIKRNFDEIVEFSGVEKFLDTPVKRYSSGMQVRLAFAVAAHLEPQIVIVDEVLAVGDMEFQTKCLGKMEAVANSGRTVLFVSHNLAAIDSLCTRCVLMQSGRAVFDGSTRTALHRYAQDAHLQPVHSLAARTDRTGNGQARVTKLGILNDRKVATTSLPLGRPLSIEITLEARDAIHHAFIALIVRNALGQRMLTVRSRDNQGLFAYELGSHELRCDIPHLPLVPGRYYVQSVLWDGDIVLDSVERAATFDVVSADVFGTGICPHPKDGVCFVNSHWTFIAGELTGLGYTFDSDFQLTTSLGASE